MIVSRAFLEAFKADKLRQELVRRTSVKEIIDFRDFQVFDGVGIATAIILLDRSWKGPTRVFHYLGRRATPDLNRKHEPDYHFYVSDLPKFDGKAWIFGSKETLALYKKIDAAGVPLGTVVRVGQCQ